MKGFDHLTPELILKLSIIDHSDFLIIAYNYRNL